MKISEIRDVIRASGWTRNDMSGSTRAEFARRSVATELQAKIAELQALVIAPRFADDAARRDQEITHCRTVIARWEALQAVAA